MSADDAGVFKATAAAVIWLQAVLGGLGPLLLRDHVRPVVTSVLNMLAAGIFLAGSCLHLLPDAQENAALTAAGCIGTPQAKCFPLAYFFFALGFLVVLLLEVFAHSLQHRLRGTMTTGGKGGTRVTEEPQRLWPRRTGEQEPLVKNESDPAAPISVGYGSHPQDDHTSLVMEPPQQSLPHQPHRHHRPHHHHHHHHHPPLVLNDSSGHPALALIVFVALSFHSVMEGMGVGAARGAAWDILLAILAHKALAAFALSLELQHHRDAVSHRQLLGTLFAFSLMTPVGILLGWLFANGDRETAASGVCTAMAGGTFLFVAVMEIIPQELAHERDLGAKSTALIVGFGAMGALAMWT